MSSLQSRNTFSERRSALSAVSQSLSSQSPSLHSYTTDAYSTPVIQSSRASSCSYSMPRAPPASTNGARIRPTAPVSMAAPVSAAPASRAPVSMASSTNLLNPPPPMFISPGAASPSHVSPEPDAEPHHQSPNVASNTGKGFGKTNFKGLGANSSKGTTISGWTAGPHSGWKGAGNKQGGLGVGKGMMKGNGMGMKGGHSWSQYYQ